MRRLGTTDDGFSYRRRERSGLTISKWRGGKDGLVEFENELVVVLLNAAPLVMGRRIPMVASRKYGFRMQGALVGSRDVAVG